MEITSLYFSLICYVLPFVSLSILIVPFVLLFKLLENSIICMHSFGAVAFIFLLNKREGCADSKVGRRSSHHKSCKNVVQMNLPSISLIPTMDRRDISTIMNEIGEQEHKDHYFLYTVGCKASMIDTFRNLMSETYYRSVLSCSISLANYIQ